MSRIAGVTALVLAGTNFLYIGFLSPPLGPPEPSAQQILAWVAANPQRLLFQFVNGYQAVLFAVLIVTLVTLTGGRPILANLAYLGAGANIAMAWTFFGIFNGLWSFVQVGQSDATVVALVSIGNSYNHAQLMSFGLAVGSVSLLALRSRTLPRALGWLGLILAAEFVLTYPVFALFPAYSTTAAVLTAGAFARVLNIVLGYAWILGTGIVLLARPIRSSL